MHTYSAHTKGGGAKAKCRSSTKKQLWASERRGLAGSSAPRRGTVRGGERVILRDTRGGCGGGWVQQIKWLAKRIGRRRWLGEVWLRERFSHWLSNHWLGKCRGDGHRLSRQLDGWLGEARVHKGLGNDR